MDIEARVENWVAWARTNTASSVACRSLERNYKSPQHWNYPELKAEIDVNDALVIEKTLTSYTFPKFNMAIIVYSQVYPWLNMDGALRKINRFRGSQLYANKDNFKDLEKKSLKILQNRL